MDIKKKEIKNLAEENTFQYGKQINAAGKVRLINVRIESLDAVVKGIHPFQVHVSKKNSTIDSYCTCPKRKNCEHVVAALFAAIDYSSKHQKHLVREKMQPQWQSFFKGIVRENGIQHLEDREQKWQLVYLFSFSAEHYSILPQKAYIKGSGELGRFSSIGQFDDIDSDVRYQPADPMLIAYLRHLGLRQNFDSSTDWVESPVDNRPFQVSYGSTPGKWIEFLKESKLFLRIDDTTVEPIQLSDKPCRIRFEFDKEEKSFSLKPLIEINGESITLGRQVFILSGEPVWVFYNFNIYRVENVSNPDFIQPFTQKHLSVKIPQKELQEFLMTAWPKLSNITDLPIPQDYDVTTFSSITQKRLVFRSTSSRLNIYLRFLYHHYQVDYHNPDKNIIKTKSADAFVKIKRDIETEEKIAKDLYDSGLKIEKGILYIEATKANEWLALHLSNLLASGYQLTGMDQLARYNIHTGNPVVKVNVSTDIDWFDLNISITIAGQPVPLQKLRRSINQGKKYVKLSDGSLAILPSNWIKRFAFLFNFANMDKENLQLPRSQLSLIDALFSEAEMARADDAYYKSIEKLKNFNKIPQAKIPESLSGTLRPYQRAGFDWLEFLKEFQLGGCLADDMGLGKTLQALTVLLSAKNQGINRSSLIICPTSVVFNWYNEIKKFTPDLEVLQHTGLNRDKESQPFQDYDIILTTYGILRRDIALLKSHTFYYIVLDESQKIKNPASQTAKAARLLKGEHRLVLTGTPLENNIQELWSQFSFLNPGQLGSLYFFRKNFVTPIEKENDPEALSFLKKLVFPFILRRTKDNVERDLPPKTEQLVYCGMNDQQKTIYDHWKDHYRSLLLHKIDTQGMDSARINILEGLVKLRQVACHPALIDQNVTEDSGKFEYVKELIEEILAENHKVLIFSQFVKMLRLLLTYFDHNRIRYEYLDGHTRNREKVVERFQTDESINVFLISLKAGGTGLNLTSADYVILYDPWWNPAVETQAMDRAHRIGQNKKVFVYRLISKDSVEEKMLELQNKKKNLVSNIIATDRSFFKDLSRDDIEILFS
jgi:non-specific serine/threonine protein kinase